MVKPPPHMMIVGRLKRIGIETIEDAIKRAESMPWAKLVTRDRPMFASGYWVFYGAKLQGL